MTTASERDTGQEGIAAMELITVEAEWLRDGSNQFAAQTTGARWNGWATPAFTQAEAHRYLAAHNAEAARLTAEGFPDMLDTGRYDVERDLFCFKWEGADDDEWEEYGRGSDGLYAIGAYGWTWSDTRDFTDDDPRKEQSA